MMIKIQINGKEIETTKNKTILDVANDNNIDIPTLCHDEELKPFGSCWVCSVKIEGSKNLSPSCGTKVMDGMKISTNSKEVLEARRTALELLTSDHYADCEAPCKLACPNEVDIQSYVSYIANGKFHEAVKVIKDTLPMPLSIGRVCPAFCEEECRRTKVEEPIAIRQLKRYASDFDNEDVWSYIPEKAEEKNKKIAVIGAGPSGLTCGYFLSNEGYKVDVFEASPEPGGWLQYGIPEYRLPKDILQSEIKLMCTNGMKIKTNTKIGDDLTIKELSKKYEAVYLAVGAQAAYPLRVKNDQIDGVLLGTDFLKSHALKNNPKIGKKVAIIGGGNTAMDCARTSKRLGSDVTIIYRRTRKEMPAEDLEIIGAEEEGINFKFLTNPVDLIGEKKLEKIELAEMKLGKPDDSGRRRPIPTGKTFVEEFDTVIAAISQKPDVDFLKEERNFVEEKQVPLTDWNTIEVEENTMYSGIENIFGGGDFRTGPSTAIEAIADGRKAAEAILRYLAGEKIEDFAKEYSSKKVKTIKELPDSEFERYDKISRFKMPELEGDVRNKNFKEIELGFSEKEAMEEAKRCLECGCHDNQDCKLRDYSTDYNVDDEIYEGFYNSFPQDDLHPFILRDTNKCINCGRCVRACSEIQGPGVLGFIDRGFSAIVAPEFGGNLNDTNCLSCGKCIEVCPIGALSEKHINYKRNPLIESVYLQNCGNCGTGCKVEVHAQTGHITKINTPDKEDQSFNKTNLCFGGKFGWQDFHSIADEPVFASGDKKEKVSWKFAKNEMSKVLKDNKSKAVVVSPNITNEELFIADNIAKKIGAELVSDNYNPLFTDKFRNSSLTVNHNDLKNAENIVVLGEISGSWRSVIRVHQLENKNLFIVDENETDYHAFADEYFKMNILDGISELKKLDLSKKTIFIYNEEKISENEIGEIWKFAFDICDFERGSGILPTSVWSNKPGFLFYEIDKFEDISYDLIILFGENIQKSEMLDKANFVISINSFNDSPNVNLFIPKATYLEIDGTKISDNYSTTFFNNPIRSAKFPFLLQLLADAGYTDDSLRETNLLLNKTEPIIEKINTISKMKKNDILNSIQNLKDEVPKVYLDEFRYIKKAKSLI